MSLTKHVSAILLAFAAGLAPAKAISPADWGEQHFIVPDGPRVGDRWDISLTPYVREPLECLAIDSPHNRVAIKKSAQTGFSTLGMVWLGYLIDVEPDRMMIVQPTIPAAREFNRDKLDPAIKASPVLKAKVRANLAKQEGSTTLSKRLPGTASLVLTGANSGADLRSKSVRFALADEVDQWPWNLGGDGDPMGMLDARQTAWKRVGTWRRLEISTPRTKGASRIDMAYEAGDQRLWHMPCPHCAKDITFIFENLQFAELPPYNPRYLCQECGDWIPAAQQRAMVLSGRWIPTKPGPGRFPTFHINALFSLLTSWDEVARGYWEARGAPEKEKAFVNLVLGESYEEKTSEVPAAAIAAHTEAYEAGVVPARCGLTSLAIDLNGDWAEWALYGFGPSAAGHGVDQWLIATDKIDGRPDDESLWRGLAELEARRWPYAGGGFFPADLVGIDSGYGTHQVYQFGRGRPRVRILDGRPVKPGDLARAMPLGSPKKIPAKDRLGRVLFKVWLYGVGSHELKSWLAHALKAYAGGAPIPGGLHLPRGLVDEARADQLVAEVLAQFERRDGRIEQRWVRRSGVRNEQLDLAVYARAVAFGARPNGLGVDRIAPDQWAALIAERHGLDPEAPDLFGGPIHVAPTAPTATPASSPARGRRVLSRGLR